MKAVIELEIESMCSLGLLSVDVQARLIRYLMQQPIGYFDVSLNRDVFFRLDVLKCEVSDVTETHAQDPCDAAESDTQEWARKRNEQ